MGSRPQPRAGYAPPPRSLPRSLPRAPQFRLEAGQRQDDVARDRLGARRIIGDLAAADGEGRRLARIDLLEQIGVGAAAHEHDVAVIFLPDQKPIGLNVTLH